jgi:uncharacterized protein
MNRLTPILVLTMTVLLGSLLVSCGDKGSDAYDRGDYATALKEWTPLAEQGEVVAQYSLGEMYINGYGVPQDYKTAMKWFTLAAEQGDATAQAWLGSMYYNGYGVPPDYKTAVKWFTLAAEQGDATAQAWLGSMYHDGEGVPQDYQTAMKWFTLAAEQGDATAQAWLGPMYYNGYGVPPDYKTAVKWFTLAAEQGDATAQAWLGSMYHNGDGVPKHYKTAMKWTTLAAEQGNASAQSNLALTKRPEQQKFLADLAAKTKAATRGANSAKKKKLWINASRTLCASKEFNAFGLKKDWIGKVQDPFMGDGGKMMLKVDIEHGSVLIDTNLHKKFEDLVLELKEGDEVKVSGRFRKGDMEGDSECLDGGGFSSLNDSPDLWSGTFAFKFTDVQNIRFK